jgi:hypothetical protein
MVRAILGVIFGYVVMVAVVFGALTAAWFGMGIDRVFEPGGYDASRTWLIVALAVGFVAAIAGGVICAVVAKRGSAAPSVLAGLVLVLGLAMAAFTMTQKGKGEPPPPRTAETTMFEAMQHAKEPTWVSFLNPVIGVIGVWTGAAMTGRRKVPTA